MRSRAILKAVQGSNSLHWSCDPVKKNIHLLTSVGRLSSCLGLCIGGSSGGGIVTVAASVGLGGWQGI